MTYEWHDLLGNIGVLLVLGAYLMVHLDKIDTQAVPYSLMNGIGAGMLSVSLYVSFNMSGLAIEFSWFLISIFGFLRSLRRSKVN